MERSVALNLIKIIEFNSSSKSTIYPVQACTPAATYRIQFKLHCLSVCLPCVSDVIKITSYICGPVLRHPALKTAELQCEACTRSWSTYLISHTSHRSKK